MSASIIIGYKSCAHTDRIPSDVRECSEAQRKFLLSGDVIDVANSKGETITRMYKKVFLNMTKRPYLLRPGKVALPADVSALAVQWVVARFNKSGANPFESTGDVVRNLEVVYAAEVLDMPRYTLHIYNLYFEPVKAHELDFDVLIQITTVKTAASCRMFYDVAYDLATLS